MLLAACPPPGGSGGGTTTYTTTVSGTVTALPPGESSPIGLPGATVSAVTTPANPTNRPVTSRSDGSFSLQVKHAGSFKLKVNNTCSQPFTSAAVSASADGSHNAGAISLTLKPEPTGTARYSITQTAPGTPGTPGNPGITAPTPATPGSYKLTVNCVRTIGNNEFASNGTIITAAAAAEGLVSTDRSRMITEIALPSTLRSIGESGFGFHSRVSGTLTIPRNVETLAKHAFRNIGSTNSVSVVFESGSRLTTIGNQGFTQSSLNNFTFPENLETIENQAFLNARFFWDTTVFPSQALIIPAKVSRIGTQAFAGVRIGIEALDIRSELLAKPATPTANFPLGNDLLGSGSLRSPAITSITLPQKVYDSYTKSDLGDIFGSSFSNYRKPDGTAYDFTSKP